jgi:hypothetical protein
VVGGGRSFCGIWPNAEDWLPDWAVIRPACPRCQTLMRSGSIRNVFTGKPPGTDDKPVINVTPVASVTEHANHTLSLTPDTVHVVVPFTDLDITSRPPT